MKVKPPKKINLFYGYRTARSMSNQNVWDEANKYSAQLMTVYGVLHILIGVISNIMFNDEVSFFIAIGSMGLFIMILFVLVESRLKKMM
jgi:uncharacterized membrane protein